MKFASKCMILKGLSSLIHSIPTYIFPLKFKLPRIILKLGRNTRKRSCHIQTGPYQPAPTYCTVIKDSVGVIRPRAQAIYSTIATDSVCGQQRPGSACADAQADLGLCCPHMQYEPFFHDRARMLLFIFIGAKV